jgi:hypothetical protein
MSMNVTEQPMRKFEGKATTAIERRTSRLPSSFYLSLAIGSMGLSAAVLLSRTSRRARRKLGDTTGLANFIGQWAPTLLVIGLYNKLVKIEEELIGEM